MTTVAPPVHVPLREILAAAARHPQTEALRHKRRGVWSSWSWADLAARTGQLAQTLLERHGQPALVAVSGDYAPGLLVFALAAAQVGAAVVTLPTRLTRPALAEWLGGAQPDLVFVGPREQVGIWRAALRAAGQAPAIVANVHLPWGYPTGAGLTSAADLLGLPPETRCAPATGEVLWIEESTDWADGLSYILHVAVQTGRTLAFPENCAAAGRDRREAQPAAFAMSAAHHVEVQRDLAARLPTGGGLVARLTRSALGAARHGRIPPHHRWLLGRVRRPFGLARLREVTVVAAASDPLGANDDLFVALGIRSDHALPPTQAELVGDTGFAFA